MTTTLDSFLWYISAPYSDPNPEIMASRYQETMTACAQFTADGEFVISPILHWHETATRLGMPTDSDFWSDYNRTLLEVCDGIIVLKLPGWEKSKGVAREIAWAKGLGLEVRYH